MTRATPTSICFGVAVVLTRTETAESYRKIKRQVLVVIGGRVGAWQIKSAMVVHTTEGAHDITFFGHSAMFVWLAEKGRRNVIGERSVLNIFGVAR